MKKFTDISLLPEIQKSLDSLGFTDPTEIQAKIIPPLLESYVKDVHAQAQTGTGKTLAFGIPLLHAVDKSKKNVQGLIIAPTRELVMQIYESLRDVSRNTGIIIEPVFGGMPIERQIEKIRRGTHIIVGTPGRLIDHLRRKVLSLKDLKVLVLDEADIMLDMGFREDIDSILDSAPKKRSIWLFSATVMSGIRKIIQSHMSDVLTIKAEKKSVISAQVKQYYSVVPTRNRIEAAARFIEVSPNFYGIIFCQTKALTAEVTERLASRGFKVNCLHGDMSQALRNRVIKGFKNKDFTILVATDVAARGIDVSSLTHVMNFSIPEEHESYIHRIGRTGRAGKEGTAILLIAPSHMRHLRQLERLTKTPLQEIPVPSLESIINAKMGAVSDFIEQSKKSDEKLSSVHKAITEMLASFSQEEISQSLIVALENLFFKDLVHESIGEINAKSMEMPQEICVEVGREHGYTEDMMRDYLYNTCKLLPQDAQKVRVLNNRTFISLPENKLNACMDSLRNNPIGAKKYRVYLVEDSFRDNRPRGRGRSDRFGGGDRDRGGQGGKRRMGPQRKPSRGR